MPIPVPSIIELSFRGTLFNQRLLNVRHYEVSVEGTIPGITASLEALMNEIDNGGPNDMVTPYLNCCGPEFVLDELRLQVVKAVRSRPVSRAVGAAGTFGSVVTAPNVSGVITLYTNLATRRGQGALHMPGLAVEAYAGGDLTAPYQVNLQAFATAVTQTISPAVGGGTYVPVIYHRDLTGALAGDAIINFTIQDTLRVMRRRTVGVGK